MKHKLSLKKCRLHQFLCTWKKVTQIDGKKPLCFLTPCFVCFPFCLWELLNSFMFASKRNKIAMLLRVLWQCVISGQSLCIGLNSRHQRGCPAWGWLNSSKSDGVIPTIYYGNRSSFPHTNNSWDQKPYLLKSSPVAQGSYRSFSAPVVLHQW